MTTNMEVCYHLMHASVSASSSASSSATNSTAASSSNTEDNTSASTANNENLIDPMKRKLIVDTCNGVSDKAKILNLHSKPHEMLDMPVIESMKATYSASSFMPGLMNKTTSRTIPNSPERILDAPDFRNDYYLNLIDWSPANALAVALDKDAYIWNAETNEISNLFYMEEESNDYICSMAWIQQRGDVLAVGNSKNLVELWDVNTKTCVRKMRSHLARVGSLAWNHHILTSGSRSGRIHLHDVRIAQHHVGTLRLHEQEVCGLKWSPDGRYLASGANDNLAVVWDGYSINAGEDARPLHVFREHRAAVKALAWCPWQSNILASGGGTADGRINIWNNHTGALVHSHDAKSQISCLLWSRHYKELISSHGFQLNQLSIWKYPEFTKVCDLPGHSDRVLMMCMSPDEETVASVGADETLRLWKCFALDDRLRRKDALGEKKASQHSLNQFIR